MNKHVVVGLLVLLHYSKIDWFIFTVFFLCGTYILFCLIDRCQIDLSTLEREKSHKIEAALEDNAGIIVMHLSITGLDAPGCESDLNAYTEKPGRRTEITKQYALKATPKKIKEIGWLQV